MFWDLSTSSLDVFQILILYNLTHLCTNFVLVYFFLGGGRAGCYNFFHLEFKISCQNVVFAGKYIEYFLHCSLMLANWRRVQGFWGEGSYHESISYQRTNNFLSCSLFEKGVFFNRQIPSHPFNQLLWQEIISATRNHFLGKYE